MEAIATQDTWIWHAYIGISGANNNINVINRLPLMTNIMKGIMPKAKFTINGRDHTMAYLLVDGIYPNWKIFVKLILQPGNCMSALYSQQQESVRKDVERCFGVLQQQFAVVSNPLRLWSNKTMKIVWTAAVILHNMIVDDKRDMEDDNNNYESNVEIDPLPIEPLTFDRMHGFIQDICNEENHFGLCNDLVQHLWNQHGGN